MRAEWGESLEMLEAIRIEGLSVGARVAVATRVPIPNMAPVVPSLASIVVGGGNEVIVDASLAHDPDGHPLRFQ